MNNGNIIKSYSQFINENINLDIANDEDYFGDIFFNNYVETEFNYHKSKKELYTQVEQFIKYINDLNNPLKLYRIIKAKNKTAINFNNLGIHCKLNNNFSKQFLKDINIFSKSNLFIMEITIDKKYIDVLNTIKNNIKYPDEEEVTILENTIFNLENIEEYIPNY